MLRWTAGTRARAEREWRESKSYAPWLNHSLPSELHNMEFDTRTKHVQNKSEPTISQTKINSCVHTKNKESLPSEEDLKYTQVKNSALQVTTPLLSQSSSSSTAAKAELLVKEMLEVKQKHNDYTQEEFEGEDNNKITTTITSADTEVKKIEKKEFTFAHERARLLKTNLENKSSIIEEFDEKKENYEKNKKNNTNSSANNYTLQKECSATKEPHNPKRLRESQRLRLSADEIALQWPLRQRNSEEHERKRYRHKLMAHYSRPSSCISSHSSNVSSISFCVVEPNLKMNSRNMNMQCKKIIKEEEQQTSEKLLDNKVETCKQNDANIIYDDYAENRSNKYKGMQKWTTINVCNAKSEERQREKEEKESTLAFASLPSESSPEEFSAFSSLVVTTPESKVMPIVTDDIDNIFDSNESRWQYDAAVNNNVLEDNDEYVREETWHKHHVNNSEFYWEEEPVDIFSLPSTTTITNIVSPDAENEIYSVAEYNVVGNSHDSHHAEWNEYCKEERRRHSFEIFNNINGKNIDNYNTLCEGSVCFNVNDTCEQCTPFVDNPLIDVTCSNETESKNNDNSNIFDYSWKKSSSGNNSTNDVGTNLLEISPAYEEEKQQQQYEELPALYEVADTYNPLYLSELCDNNSFECDSNKDYINPEHLFDATNESTQEPCELYTQNMLSRTYTNNVNMYVNRTASPNNRIKHVEMQDKIKNHNREPYKYGGISERCRQFRERCRRRKHL